MRSYAVAASLFRSSFIQIGIRRIGFPYVDGMITNEERAALARFAKYIWGHGARSDALIIDAGCYTGASTLALAAGLSESRVPVKERRGRIWCYDLFRTTSLMSAHYLKDSGLKPGDSFQPIFEKNVSAYSDYIMLHPGDIQQAPTPDAPIAILFVDILWSWDCANFLGRKFYTRLDPGRSLLIHQDFVFPMYPWIILGMGQLAKFFAFSYNVRYSSVVFDVLRTVREGDIEDPRNIAPARGLAIYDEFIDRLEGWCRGSVGFSKAIYLAFLNRVEDARRLIDEIAAKFADEPLVTQYLALVRGYCELVEAAGQPIPLEHVVGG